jgi:hypothetical protein
VEPDPHGNEENSFRPPFVDNTEFGIAENDAFERDYYDLARRDFEWELTAELQVDLWKSADFKIVMQNTVTGLVLALIIQVGLGLLFAYLIFRTRVGFRLYRALVFLPVVLSPAAVALMFTLVFNADIGPLNVILKAVGLTSWTRNWLADKNVTFYAVLTPMIYQYIGLYVVILLAGMQAMVSEANHAPRHVFTQALDISAFTLVAMARRAAAVMPQGGAIVGMTYYGSEKTIPGYNVMGVAKAALEACTRYLAADTSCVSPATPGRLLRSIRGRSASAWPETG